jgi:GNAT superfamily N-acetyltransferase
MDNTGPGKAFDEGSFSEKSIRVLLKLSISKPENFSPTIVAIDQDNDALVGVMLGSRPLGMREKAAQSADKRLAEIYRLIDAGKFPFTDAADKAKAQSEIWVPCGIITVADEKYRGQGIGRRLYKEALNSLQQEPYRSVKYLATGHKVANTASTGLHDSVGASKEYESDSDFLYDEGKKCLRFIRVNAGEA